MSHSLVELESPCGDEQAPVAPPAQVAADETTSSIPAGNSGDDGRPSKSRGDASLVTLAVLAILYTVYMARAVLFPMALAVVLALLFRPLVRRLNKSRIPEWVGAGLVVFLLLATVVGGGMQLLTPAADWFKKMPTHLSTVETRLRKLREPMEEINESSRKVEEITQVGASAVDQPLQVQIKQPPLTNLVLSTTGNVLAGAAVTIIMLYFLLALGDRFLNNVVRVMPTFRSKRDVVELVHKVERGVSSYLFTVTVINICLGAVIAFAMWLLGMPNPVLWGLMATLLNYFPYIGALTGTGVVFVVAVVSFDSMLFAAAVPVVYFSVTALEGNLVTPTLLGRSMELNPILVFVSLAFWGWMWGVGGALLAVPLLAIMKLMLDQFESTKSLGTLIG